MSDVPPTRNPVLPDRSPLVSYEMDGKPASLAVVDAVEIAGIDTDAAPLYEALDPEALDALFSSRSDGRTPREGVVVFEHWGVLVVVTDGTVRVYTLE